MSSLTKICLLIAILLLAMEVRGGKIPMMEEAMDKTMDENEAVSQQRWLTLLHTMQRIKIKTANVEIT